MTELDDVIAFPMLKSSVRAVLVSIKTNCLSKKKIINWSADIEIVGDLTAEH